MILPPLFASRDVRTSSKGGAVFSHGGRQRDLLWRHVDTHKTGRAVFVMLNPSTAGADEDDPTIRRCMGFARAWGVRELAVVNLYPWIATDPRDLARAIADRAYVPVVGDVVDVCAVAGMTDTTHVVAAWGAKDPHTRGASMRDWLRPLAPLFHLGLTKDGSPRHPLYLAASTPLTPWGA